MEEKEDVLNREEFINKVINLIEIIAQNNKSCCFAIDGQWGSGKSFVLNKIEKKLVREQSEELAGDKYFVFYYDCWKYDYYEEPLLSIISSMMDHIEDKIMLFPEDKREKILELVKVVGKALMTLAVKQRFGMEFDETINSVIDSLLKEKTKEYDTYFPFKNVLETVRKKIKEIAEIQPVIIIVDELDRCLPTYTIKVLERLHHVFEGIEKAIVIIAMDKTQIGKSLEKIYGDSLDVDKYLRKFIAFDLYLDTGTASKFLEKYEQYVNLFDIRDEEAEKIEHFMTDLTEGIDIRTQEKIFEKAESLHKLLSKEEKMDAAILLLEIMILCTKEKIKDNDLKWVIDNSIDTDLDLIEKVGREYIHKVRSYEEKSINGNHVSVYKNGMQKVIQDTSFGRMVFLISSLYNEVKEGICGLYYYDKPFENEITFANKIYKALSI